jgi:transposase
MATRYTDEFQRYAVRIATTSGLTRPPVSSDLGVGLSTLNKWVQKHQHDDLMIIIVAPVVRATMAMP